MLKLNCENINVETLEFSESYETVKNALEVLLSRNGKGADFTGWLNYFDEIDENTINSISKKAEEIKANADVFLVLGIGGSYLGAKSFISATNNYFSKNKPEIIFLGQNLDEDYINDVKEYIKDKSIYMNVISKSGSTIETAVSFRIFRKFMEEKYGENHKNRIIATTDEKNGILRGYVDKNNISSFVVPSNIGGRYSIFTPVGLLPLAVDGVDIHKLLSVYKESMFKYTVFSNDNILLKYTAFRNMCYNQGKKVEVLSNFSPKLNYFAEWVKQVFGESEGKNNKGILPISMNFTTDLHSLGQYMQDGERIIFETILDIKNTNSIERIEKEEYDFDKLNYLYGKRISDINRAAINGTTKAHIDGGVPVVLLSIDDNSMESLVELYTFYMVSAAVSAYALDVNPFDQPGVEAYKSNMFELLGRDY